MNDKRNTILAVILMGVLALSRWPKLFPPNFSAIYGLVFCAGVFLPKKMAWYVPLGTLLLTDIALNFYYKAWRSEVLLYIGINYIAYVAVIFLGRRFQPKSSFLSLLSGGLLGAVLFYLLTNTMAWLVNPFQAPEYTRDLSGWLRALTMGTPGHPPTWEFFRNTLLSGGLFTGLFAGAMKLAEQPEPETEEEESAAPEKGDEPQKA